MFSHAGTVEAASIIKDRETGCLGIEALVAARMS
jgi:hypothetical protein